MRGGRPAAPFLSHASPFIARRSPGARHGARRGARRDRRAAISERRAKKTPLSRGVGRLLVCGGVSLLLLSGQGTVFDERHCLPDPCLLIRIPVIVLNPLRPLVASFPTLDVCPVINKQHPCQCPRVGPRLDISAWGLAVIVTQSTLLAAPGMGAGLVSRDPGSTGSVGSHPECQNTRHVRARAFASRPGRA